ncbi:hypothetical protein ABPG75_001291 [Micractinium tetrahymenae]
MEAGAAHPSSGAAALGAELAFMQLLEELAIPSTAGWQATQELLQCEHADDQRYCAVQPASREGLFRRHTEEQAQLEAQLESLEREQWQQVQRQLASSNEGAPLLSLEIHKASCSSCRPALPGSAACGRSTCQAAASCSSYQPALASSAAWECSTRRAVQVCRSCQPALAGSAACGCSTCRAVSSCSSCQPALASSAG